MKEFRREELLTLSEVARFCGLSRNALYMRYFRGQIKAADTLSHKLYFTREAVDEFRAKYCIYN